MTQAPTSAEVLKSLKKVLSHKGLTYIDVGRALSLSLPQTKRIMAKGNLSLDRVLQLCRLCGISLSTLEELSTGQRIRPFRFTSEQEAILAAKPHLLALLFSLRDSQGDLGKICAEFPTHARVIHRWGAELEQKGLATMSEEGKLTSPISHERWTAWNEYGELGRAHTKFIWKALGERMLSPEGQKGCLRMGGIPLSPKHMGRVRQDIEELFARWREMSHSDSRKGQAREEFTFLFSGDFWRDPFFDLESYL